MERGTPGLACVVGTEATVNVCGVAVGEAAGVQLDASLVDRPVVNVGPSGPALARAASAAAGQAHRSHGITSAAINVEQAVLQAISVDMIASLSLHIVTAGGTLTDLPEHDLSDLPDLGDGFNTDTAWRHELARL